MHPGMPQVTPEHKRLHALAGSWTSEEKLHPSPWDEKGGTATGHAETRVAMDGFYVITNYEQNRGGQVGYRGHGVFGYDPKKRQWFMSWSDNMGGMAPTPVWGTFEGNTLTFEHGGAEGCPPSRYVYRFDKDGQYGFSILSAQDGKHWKPFMEGTYHRK